MRKDNVQEQAEGSMVPNKQQNVNSYKKTWNSWVIRLRGAQILDSFTLDYRMQCGQIISTIYPPTSTFYQPSYLLPTSSAASSLESIHNEAVMMKSNGQTANWSLPISKAIQTNQWGIFFKSMTTTLICPAQLCCKRTLNFLNIFILFIGNLNDPIKI